MNKELQKKDIPIINVRRARGAYLYDFTGQKYIDFGLNNGSLILGHTNPKVTRYIKNQINKGYVKTQVEHLQRRLESLILESYSGFKGVDFSHSWLEFWHKVYNLFSLEKEDSTRDRKKILFVGRKYAELMNNRFFSDMTLVLDSCLAEEDILYEIKKALVNNCLEALCLEPLRYDFSEYSKGFWKELEGLCKREGLKLIFDEEESAFRVSYSFAFPIIPDYVLLGNVIGGGFPLRGICFLNGALEELYVSDASLSYVLYYVSGLETLKYLRRERPYEGMSKLLSLLKEQLKGSDIIINDSVTMFQIVPKDSIICDELLNIKIYKDVYEEKILLNAGFNAKQYLSSQHNEHDIKRFSKVLKKVVKF